MRRFQNYTACAIIGAMEERLYTSAEVGKLTGRQAQTVRTLAQRKGIGRKIGRDWLFTESELRLLREIDPRGGRPPADGKPPAYRTPVAAMRRKGPKPRRSVAEPSLSQP